MVDIFNRIGSFLTDYRRVWEIDKASSFTDLTPSKVALFGASGKMGTRISDKLREAFDYELLPVEMGGVCVGATAPARF